MNPVTRHCLHFGPYNPPRCRIGRRLKCLVRGRLEVVGISDAPIQWPQARRDRGGGRPFLIVCGDLARAIRRESATAVAYWWGVTAQTVTMWRKVLGVPEHNEGTSRLFAAWMPERFDERARERLAEANRSPERAAKIAAAKRGKPRPPHVLAALRAANQGRTLSAETRRKMSEAHRRRGTRPPAAGDPWTEQQLAQLGSSPDRDVAARIGRPLGAVRSMRNKLGIPRFRGESPAGSAAEEMPKRPKGRPRKA